MDQVAHEHVGGIHTVMFKLTTPNADFPYITIDYHLTIKPTGTMGKQFDEGIGTGGYALKRLEPGGSE